MNGTELRLALAKVLWSPNRLAQALGVDERRVRRWSKGDYPIPRDVATWLRLVADFHENHPPPKTPL